MTKQAIEREIDKHRTKVIEQGLLLHGIYKRLEKHLDDVLKSGSWEEDLKTLGVITHVLKERDSMRQSRLYSKLRLVELNKLLKEEK